MTLPLPIFIDSKAAHLREAKLWADRLPHYTEPDKKRAAKVIVKHLLAVLKHEANGK